MQQFWMNGTKAHLSVNVEMRAPISKIFLFFGLFVIR